MKFSIRSVLLVSFLVVIWGTYLVTASLSQYSSERTLENHARLIMDNIAAYAMEQSQNYLSKAELAANLTKRLLRSRVLGEENPAALEAYFLEQLRLYPDISGIYLGTPGGEFYYVSRNASRSPGGFRTKEITYDREGARRVRLDWWDADGNAVGVERPIEDHYDPRLRPWYRGAISSGGIYWTDPYIFYTSQNPGITISGLSMRPDGSLRGVVGVDIEIDQLSTFIANLRIGHSGKALLLNRNRQLVAFHDVERIKYHGPDGKRDERLVTIDEFSDPLSRKAVSAIGLPPGQTVHLEAARFAKFSHAGETYLTMFTPFPNSNWPWVIGLYMPEQDYLGALRENRHQMRMVALGISLLASVFACWLAASLSRPIVGLRRFAQGGAEGAAEEAPVLSSSRFLEISQTADCFEQIQQDLENQTLGRRHAESHLQQVEEQYRLLLQNLNVGVFRTRPDGSLVSASPEFVRMTGFGSLEEMKALRMEEFYHDPQDRQRLIRLLRERGRVSGFEVRVKSPLGEAPRWVQLHATLTRTSEGELIDGLVEDISERKRQEEMLIAAERMAAVGTLTSGVAHEFNNINTAVLGYAELGLQQEGLSSKGAAYFDMVRTAALRSKELTGSLLSISNRDQTHMTPGRLDEVVAESLALVKGEMASEGIVFVEELRPVPVMLFDRLQIGQVVLNLLLNARHALLGQPRKEISVSIGQEGGEVWLRVEDSGCGIEAEDLPRIFTPFFTTKGEYASQDSQQSKVKGSGLGLSVCQTIALNHRGSLTVESAPGQGSCFLLKLPFVAAGEDVGGERAEEKLSQPGSGGRVLVLDDEPAVRDIVGQVLGREGYQVVGTDDGREALQMIARGAPELILVDMQMPKMSGREFLAGLQVLALERRPAVLILTGQLTENGGIEKFREYGVAGLLSKPFTASELRRQVGQVFGVLSAS